MTVLAYLAAIVAANLFAATFGPWWSIVSALVMIGATLTLRDKLHDAWHHDGLAWKMAALIGTGGAISWLISHNAGRVAVASCTAFVASEAVDTLVYALMHRRPWQQRVNGSNLASAAVDSVIFPTLAFGGLMWGVVLAQYAAKVLGGAAWGWILARRRAAATAGALCLLACVGRSANAQAHGPPRFVVQAQAGANFYPTQYQPTKNAGLNAIIFLPRGFSILTVVSRDMATGSPWVGVLALQYRIWGF